MNRILSILTLGFMVSVWAAPLADAAAAKGKGKAKPPAEEGGGGDEGGGNEGGGAPADDGGGGGGHGAADGYGKNAKGAGGGGKTVSGSAIVGALKSGGAIQITKGDYDLPYDQVVIKGNSTVDGGGATLYFPSSNHNGKGVSIYGANVVLRNLRIRNAGDNLGFGSSSFKGTKDVLVENVSCTGSGDDNWSVAYNCSNITIRWSMAAGGNRNCFYKYGGANLTIHHSILTRAWIRNPLCSGASATIDFRNNLVEHWKMWGTRTESGSKGNFVNNTWRFESWAGGKADAALFSMGGEFYSSGNVFIGCKERPGGAKAPVVQAPAINGQTDAKTALSAVLSDTNGAGCMPRDAIDKEYLSIKKTAPGGDGAVGLVVPSAERKGGGGKK
mgnify:CR=1 FL=1